ncbi:FxLYD domain-containing protein [bacterium]|nr:FxLYD domain-containing protein [bacterium]
MNEFQVTFLDRPEVGRTVRIIYNGQVGQTARIISVQQHPSQPNYFKVVAEQNVICIGVFNPSAQTTVPAQTQAMQAPPPVIMPKTEAAKNNFPKWLSVPIGCLGLFILLGIIGALVGGTQTGSSDSTPATEDTSQTTKDLTLQDWSVEGQSIKGVVKNNSNRTYSYVQIEFNVYDSSNAQIGSAMANINNLEPGGIWKFEAVALEDNVASAKFKDLSGW